MQEAASSRGGGSLKSAAASRRRPIHVGTALMPHVLEEEEDYARLAEEHFSLAVVEHHLKVS